MQVRTDPVLDAHGDDIHPAFGIAGIQRVSATPGEVMFQSDIRHFEYIRITFSEASRKRDISHDWVHPGKLVCEVSMSLSQFASFVTSGGTEGVPCTINFTGSGENPAGYRPGLNPASRLAKTHAEVRQAATEAYSHIQEAFREYEATLSDSGKGSALARKNAIRKLSAAISNAVPNVEYAAKTLDRHTEEVVEQARGDIEAMAVRAAERLGISPGEVLEIES